MSWSSSAKSVKHYVLLHSVKAPAKFLKYKYRHNNGSYLQVKPSSWHCGVILIFFALGRSKEFTNFQPLQANDSLFELRYQQYEIEMNAFTQSLKIDLKGQQEKKQLKYVYARL